MGEVQTIVLELDSKGRCLLGGKWHGKHSQKRIQYILTNIFPLLENPVKIQFKDRKP